MFRFISSIILSFFYITFLHAAPLPVNQAFELTEKVVDPNTFELNWKIKPGFYLYQSRIHLEPKATEFFQLGRFQLPKSEEKINKLNQLEKVYRDQLSLKIPILGLAPGESELVVYYQGCSAEGYCYPPQQQHYMIQIDVHHALAKLSPSLAEVKTSSFAMADPLTSVFKDHTVWFVMLSFLGFGLLLSFTPCILPMIPVLSGIILRNQQTMKPKMAFLLSLSYVLGVSCTYALLGAVIALLGSNLQLLFQSSIAIGALAVLFFLLSLSMFDLFEIRMPNTWQARFSQFSQLQKSSSYISAFFMGCLSVLILSPCVTPPLVGALAYVAETGNVVLGTAALFFLGLGSGLPLLVLSLSASHFLPKVGHWMHMVKTFFGLLLLAVAVQLFSRIVPPIISMVLWGSLLLSTGVFIGALLPAYSSLEKGRQVIGMLFLLAGVFILIGAGMGHTNPLQPLAYARSSENHSLKQSQVVVTTLKELRQALTSHQGQVMMLDYYADWCVACKLMETNVFHTEQFEQAVKNITLIKIDITKNNADSQALLEAYQVVGPPTFLFINASGQEVREMRITGERSIDAFTERFQKLARNASPPQESFLKNR